MSVSHQGRCFVGTDVAVMIFSLGSCIFRSDLKNTVSYRYDRSTYRND
jgi:hypothetical protein